MEAAYPARIQAVCRGGGPRSAGSAPPAGQGLRIFGPQCSGIQGRTGLWLWHPESRSLTVPHALQDLLMSYNIGVDRDKERRDLMSATAARVGFSLPDFPDETLAQEQENKS